MNDLQIFSNPEFGEIRTVSIEGEPWFVGKDIAEALGYKNSRQAITTNVDDDDKGVHPVDTLRGSQEMTIINESGVYSLVFGSHLPTAKAFKRWVTSEVLPSIRKTGGYQARPMSTTELFALQVQVNQEHERKIAELTARTEKAETKIVQAAELFTAPAVSKDDWQAKTNAAINEIIEANGLNHQTFRARLYEALEERANVSLARRQNNLKKRMRLAGATYKEADAVTKLHVIAQDPKLREIFQSLVQAKKAQILCKGWADEETGCPEVQEVPL